MLERISTTPPPSLHVPCHLPSAPACLPFMLRMRTPLTKPLARGGPSSSACRPLYSPASLLAGMALKGRQGWIQCSRRWKAARRTVLVACAHLRLLLCFFARIFSLPAACLARWYLFLPHLLRCPARQLEENTSFYL